MTAPKLRMLASEWGLSVLSRRRAEPGEDRCGGVVIPAAVQGDCEGLGHGGPSSERPCCGRVVARQEEGADDQGEQVI